MKSELEIIDDLNADARVSLGIVHGSAVALEQGPSLGNPQTIAAAIRYVEVALERIIKNVGALDAMRKQREPQRRPATAGEATIRSAR